MQLVVLLLRVKVSIRLVDRKHKPPTREAVSSRGFGSVEKGIHLQNRGYTIKRTFAPFLKLHIAWEGFTFSRVCSPPADNGIT